MDRNPIIDVTDVRRAQIYLGVFGTYNARSQVFDITAWKGLHGPGSFQVALLRPGDMVPYAVRDVVVDGSLATWTFDAADTAVAGRGVAFLSYANEAGTILDETIDIPVIIASNSGPVGQAVPHPLENWYDDVLAASAEAKAASQSAQAAESGAEAAQTAAETAQGKAEDAQTAAETAQTAAETAQGKAEDAQTAAEAAQTASEAAQGKAEDAQTAAEAAQTAAETAQDKAEDAQTASESAQAAAETAEGDAEAWAIGKRGGVDVPSTDPAYHNNSKYWADIAGSIVPDLQLVIVDGALCQIITTT